MNTLPLDLENIILKMKNEMEHIEKMEKVLEKIKTYRKNDYVYIRTKSYYYLSSNTLIIKNKDGIIKYNLFEDNDKYFLMNIGFFGIN